MINLRRIIHPLVVCVTISALASCSAKPTQPAPIEPWWNGTWTLVSSRGLPLPTMYSPATPRFVLDSATLVLNESTKKGWFAEYRHDLDQPSVPWQMCIMPIVFTATATQVAVKADPAFYQECIPSSVTLTYARNGSQLVGQLQSVWTYIKRSDETGEPAWLTTTF